MKESTLRLLNTMQVNEATDCLIYRKLAKRAKGPNRDLLIQMAEDEARHCATWGKYTGKHAVPNKLKVFWYNILGFLFGLTFVINLLESAENTAGEHNGGPLGERA